MSVTVNFNPGSTWLGGMDGWDFLYPFIMLCISGYVLSNSQNIATSDLIPRPPFQRQSTNIILSEKEKEIDIR